MKIKNSLLLGASFALTIGSAFAAPLAPSIILEDSPVEHADLSGPAHDANLKIRHQKNMKATGGVKKSNANAPASADVGDVAVMVDDGVFVIPASAPNLYDLPPGTSLTFIPGADSFSVSSGAVPLDGTIGASLGLGDDDTTEVNFPAGFPFLGTVYNAINVNSDGNITLGSGNGDGASTARDAGRLVSGPPRIAPFFVDLDVTAGGSITADVRANSLVVTWTNVPQFGMGDSNTFQVVLNDTGVIDIVHSNIAATAGVVGIAEGASEGPFNDIDLSADLPGTFDAGAIFEEFSPGQALPSVDTIALANAFYETHDDKYDFIVIFTDFISDLGGGFAFHQGLQNQTEGIGFTRNGASARFDFSGVAGSDGELESILHMNRIGLYWPDAGKLVNPPIKQHRISPSVFKTAGKSERIRARNMGTLNGDFGAHGTYTLGLNSAMSIMAQEAGHRWLAFEAIFPPAGSGFFDLLGRANAHWSFFFNVEVPASQFPDGDPRASSAEGNAIADLGASPLCPGQTLFETKPQELVDGFTLLDQYIMGILDPADVGSLWYVNNPTILTPLNISNTTGAVNNVQMCGDRVDLTLSDITNLGAFFGLPSNGPREVFDRVTGASLGAIPGDEIDTDSSGAPADDVKTMAFILVTQDGANAADIKHVDTFRQTAEDYLNGAATGGRGRFDTSLNPETH